MKTVTTVGTPTVDRAAIDPGRKTSRGETLG
jgi:hypothetical protein